MAIGSESLVEASREEAGFEAGGADEGQLAEGDAFDGPKFLRVGGLIEVDEVVAEVADFIDLFQIGHGKDGGGEAVLAGILSGLSFTGGGTGAGRFLSVDAVGGDLFVRGHVWLPFNSGVAWRLGEIGGENGKWFGISGKKLKISVNGNGRRMRGSVVAAAKPG